MPIAETTAILGAAALSAGSQMAVSGMGKKKAYKYNSKLQEEQAAYNRALAEYQNAENERLMDKAYQQNVEQWQRENQANIDFWNMQNAYNTPSAQMARMRAAGLNANVGDVGASNAGDLTAASSPQLAYSDTVGYAMNGGSGVSDDMVNPFSGLSSALQQYFNYEESKRIHDKQLEMYDAVITGKNLDNDLKNVTFDERVAKYGLQNDYTRGLVEKNKYTIDNILPLEKKLKESAYNTSQINYTYLQNTLQDRIKRIDIGNKLMSSQVSLNTSNKDLIDAKKIFQDIQNKYADESFTTDINLKKSQTYFTQSKYNLQQMKNKLFSALQNPNTLSAAEKEFSLTMLGLATGSVYSMASRIGTYINQSGVTQSKYDATMRNKYRIPLDLLGLTSIPQTYNALRQMFSD